MSTTVTITAISSFIGFVLNSAILYLVLSRGKRKYHYLFAGILLICAVWDLSITITMLRNEHPGDLILLGKILNIVCIFLLPLIFHFTCSYGSLALGGRSMMYIITAGGIFGKAIKFL
jgi:hypothetical protein